MFHLFFLERQSVFKWRRDSLSYLRRALTLSLLKVSVCELCMTEVCVVGCVVYFVPFADSGIVKPPPSFKLNSWFFFPFGVFT